LNAFQYAYQFPGMTRVLQTAGRVIRSATDRGVIVLVDPRFARNDFRALLPHHWRPQPCRTVAAVRQSLEKFWPPIRPDAATAADEG
jgi:DNA excision repair protein ERCC-2